MIDPEDIIRSERDIRPHVRTTPVERSGSLVGDGCDVVHLKLENQQETGSFKLRGAFNRLLQLDESERSVGVVTASTGNHGAAVARAGRRLGVPVRVFVPRDAEPAKLAAIENDGAVIERSGDDCVEAELAARACADLSGMPYVSPYNDPIVIRGQGTVAVEMHRQIGEVDAVFVAVGGGGLIGGVGAYLKSVSPEVEIIACSPERSAVMHHSLEAGRIVEMTSESTLSDATAGGIEPGSITFDLCRTVVDRSILVNEDEIARAMRLLVGSHHLMVEGAAGVAVAGFLRERPRYAGRSVAIVICGANASLEVLHGVLS